MMPQAKELPPDDERAVIASAAAGSAASLETLFRMHATSVHRTAYLILLSADDAEDVVQDVFVGLPEALAAYRGSGSFAGWLRAVTIRMAFMRLRAARRREATASASALDFDRRDDAALDRLGLEAALRRLSPDLRIVFVLSEVEGYTHKEIALLLRIRTGTSEVRLHRARRQLRVILEDL